MATFRPDEHFSKFLQDVRHIREIKYKNLSDEDRLEQQYRQIKKLIELEKDFADYLNSKPRLAAQVYGALCNLICVQKRNVSAARPFFREKKGIFAKKISPMLKNNDIEGLKTCGYRFNWKFIQFTMELRDWGKNSELTKIYDKIKKMRAEIVEYNLPLAISQAKLFWKMAPESHLTYMDVVQIQVQGLMTGVDKFIPDEKKGMSHEKLLEVYRNFRPTAIGFMMRDRMNSYSQQLIHFSTKDKKILYRANKLLKAFNEDANSDLFISLVNQNMPRSEFADEAEIKELVSANSMVSIVPGKSGSDRTVGYEMYSSIEDENESSRPDACLEENNAMEAMKLAILKLDLFEQKFMMMKGIKI